MGKSGLAAALDHEERRLAPTAAVDAATRRIVASAVEILGRHARELASGGLQHAATDCFAIARGLVDGAAAGPPRSRESLRRDVMRALLGYLTVRLD